MSKKEVIQGFIQNIYAFIIGFGFFQLKVTDINFSLDVNWEIIFNILLYLFTFIIAAHDWLEYHKKNLSEDISMLRSLPQVMSLLSVGFMFLHSTYNELLLWTVGGVSLTIWNFIGVFPIKKGSSLWYWIPSIVLIVIAVTIAVLAYDNTYPGKKVVTFNDTYVIYLLILQLIIYVIWTAKYYCYGKKEEKEAAVEQSKKLLTQLGETQTLYEQLVLKYEGDIKKLSALHTTLSENMEEMEELKKSTKSKIEALKALITKT